jgi:hypothetical protein
VKTLALLAAVAAVAAGALVVQGRASAQAEARLAAVASEIARRDVGVRCQTLLGELLDVGVAAGSVQFDAAGRPADETHLTRNVCRGLRRFADDPATASLDCVRAARTCPSDAFDLVQALHTLAHEAWHLAGIRAEAQTECYALQTTGLVATRLGADRATADAVQRYAFERLYPSLPDSYRSGDCRAGGALDLLPDSPWFP